MPWCEGCNRYLTAPTVNRDGTCPRCGRSLIAGMAEAADEPRAPWHFKLLVAAAGVYLAMRAFQGIAWVVRQVG